LFQPLNHPSPRFRPSLQTPSTTSATFPPSPTFSTSPSSLPLLPPSTPPFTHPLQSPPQSVSSAPSTCPSHTSTSAPRWVSGYATCGERAVERVMATRLSGCLVCSRLGNRGDAWKEKREIGAAFG